MVFIYLFGKLIAYTFVCAVGLLWFRPVVHRPLVWAVLLGAGRVAMGVGVGLLIYLASTTLYGALPDQLPRGAVTYLIVYVPIRWIEWSCVALVLLPSARRLVSFWIGADRRDRLWRLLGVGVSCAADIPMILSVGGLPIGRFFC